MYQYHHQFLNISSDRIFIFLLLLSPVSVNSSTIWVDFFFWKVNLVSQWVFFQVFSISHGFSCFFHICSWFLMVFHGFSCFFPCFFIWMAGSDLHHQQHRHLLRSRSSRSLELQVLSSCVATLWIWVIKNWNDTLWLFNIYIIYNNNNNNNSNNSNNNSSNNNNNIYIYT